MSRRTSLTGQIMEQWHRDGKPTLTWQELLQRTVDADERLERIGLNPAAAFRRYRKGLDRAQMERYIVGFYEYEFSPNYSPRKRQKDSNAKPRTLEVSLGQ